MSKGTAKAPSQRQLRVGEEIRHAIAWMLERGDIHDPGLRAVTLTVTEVRVSPDLKNATAYVVPMGGGEIGDALSALDRAKSFIRKRVGETVRLRHVPRMAFAFDTSFDEAAHIDALLHDPRVARDLLPHEGEADSDEPPADEPASTMPDSDAPKPDKD